MVKHGYNGSTIKEGLAKKYCAAFNVYGQFCEPGTGYDKKHVPFHRLKPQEKAAQYEHVKRNKNDITINGSEVQDLLEYAKSLEIFPGCGEI